MISTTSDLVKLLMHRYHQKHIWQCPKVEKKIDQPRRKNKTKQSFLASFPPTELVVPDCSTDTHLGDKHAMLKKLID